MMPEDFTDEEKKWVASFFKACLDDENFTEQGSTPRAKQYVIDELEKMGY